MFQGKLQTKSQLVLKRLVACIFLWTALNKTTLFSIFKLKLLIESYQYLMVGKL